MRIIQQREYKSESGLTFLYSYLSQLSFKSEEQGIPSGICIKEQVQEGETKSCL